MGSGQAMMNPGTIGGDQQHAGFRPVDCNCAARAADQFPARGAAVASGWSLLSSALAIKPVVFISSMKVRR
jgi:hypothetical protein